MEHPTQQPKKAYSTSHHTQSIWKRYSSIIDRTVITGMISSVLILGISAVSLRFDEQEREKIYTYLHLPPAISYQDTTTQPLTPLPVTVDSASMHYLSMTPRLYDIANKMQVPPDLKNQVFTSDPTIRSKLQEAVRFGYRIGDPDANWQLAQRKSPYQIAEERMRLGVPLYAAFLGIIPGTVPNKETSDSIMTNELPKVMAIARQQGLTNPLLYARVVWQETRGKKRSMSRSGAMGGPQIPSGNYAPGHFDNKSKHYIPHPNPSLPPVNPFTTAAHNTGAKLLKIATDRFPSEDLALVAYNQGVGVVDSANDVAAATKLLIDYYGDPDSIKVHFPQGKNKAGQVRALFRREDGRDPAPIKITSKDVLDARDPRTGDYIISEEGRNYPKHVHEASITIDTLVKKLFLAQKK